MRQLDRQVSSQLYERLLLSRNQASLLGKAAEVRPGDLLSPEEAIRDPFVLAFLDVKDEYSESDLETAWIQHLADFLLELGDDFAFIGRQRRLRIDDSWFRVDLVFFRRRLRCLLIIDLKVGRFSYADAGQMYLYLIAHDKQLADVPRCSWGHRLVPIPMACSVGFLGRLLTRW